MYYNYYQAKEHECRDCTAKGICSANPTLSSLQEVILQYLKELAYYLLKLHELGVHNENIKQNIVNSLSGITCSAEYTQQAFCSIISALHRDLNQSKSIYIDLCRRHQLECHMIKTYFKQNKIFSYVEAIKKGEKFILKKNSLFSEEQKNLFDIMLFLTKSICIKYVELKNLGEEFQKACYATLKILSFMNSSNPTIADSKEEIEIFIGVYNDLCRNIHEAQIKKYGKPSMREVSTSTKEGKAILISGSDLSELEALLKIAENKGVNVYTHGLEMLMGHAYPRLNQYKSLVGHYGSGIDDCLIDFATFPGTILMTKKPMRKLEGLYRGRLFSTDTVTPRGVIQIQKGDFTPVINSALDAKGFSSTKFSEPIKVGYNEEEIKAKIDYIINKITSGEIEYMYIIGLLNHVNNYKYYFEKFMHLIPKNCFVLSLSLAQNRDNFLHIDSYFDYALIYQILEQMSKVKPIREYNINIFVTKCDENSISNLLNLRKMGVKNVFICKCPPSFINPSLITTLEKIFGIREMTTPEEDLAKCKQN